MKYLVVIPARMESSRLPGKPLVLLNGKTMIQRTYERVCLAVPKERIIVATDHDEILNHCNEVGMNVIMTSPECLTGTDRVAEVASAIDADIYINVQGDEPMMNPKDVETVMNLAKDFPTDIINGYAAIDERDWLSTSIPKVVVDQNNLLLYMSRAPIPHNKSGSFTSAKRQVCVYAFPKKQLLEFAQLRRKTPLEEIEDLEMLRFLELGYKIRMVELTQESIAVDTPDDVVKVEKLLRDIEGVH